MRYIDPQGTELLDTEEVDEGFDPKDESRYGMGSKGGYSSKGAKGGGGSGGSGVTSSLSKGEVCFAEETQIATEHGHKNIEDIKVGDLVWATDEETGETALKEVVQLFRNETMEWVHVTVDGEKITCTPEHPFYSPVKGWTSAIDLRAGDILVMLNGEYVVVEQVQHELLESPETTYNFEVEDYHTYYVGEDHILVHNECKPKSAGNMQKQVEAGQAPKGVDSVHKAHTLPHGKPHVHFSDGTSLNYDGTIHDKLGGIPKLTRTIRSWLEKNGWKGN